MACNNPEKDIKTIETITDTIMNDIEIEDDLKYREIFLTIMNSSINRKMKSFMKNAAAMTTFDYNNYKQYMEKEGYPDWESKILKKYFPINN